MDLYDRRLLYELDKDASQSLSRLAKKLQRSKQFVAYRLKRLEEEVILGYQAIVDMSKMGYFAFRVYIKFRQMMKDDEKAFVEHLKNKAPHIWTIIKAHGRWDYALVIGVTNAHQFHETWDQVQVFQDFLRGHRVALYAPIHNFNKTFGIKDADIVERTYGTSSSEEVSEKDKEILHIYSNNVRMPLSDIAQKVGVSPDTVRRKIKSLEERGIIVGYKLMLDHRKLALTAYQVDMLLKTVDRKREMREYCRKHPAIYQINDTIGGATFEIEVLVADFTELLEVIDEFRERFDDVIADINHFEFSTFLTLRYLSA